MRERRLYDTIYIRNNNYYMNILYVYIIVRGVSSMYLYI